MKKIASLFASLRVWWWVEKVQANLSIWLTDIWYNFTHIVCKDVQPRNEYKWKIISINKPFIIGFWLKKIISLFTNTYKIVKICKKENIDILIWQWDYFFMISWLAKIFWFKWKNIAVVHTTISIWPKVINRILRFFLSLHDKIILISKEEYNTFINKYWFKKEKLDIIYNAINIEKINNLIKEDIDDISFEKFTFINIWRLNYQKWQNRLLEAFDMFNKKHPSSQLIILWDWELKQNLFHQKKLLKSNKNIHFLGNKTNVYKYIKKSNCFILSSNFEGFPVVLIESICLWIPIISTDCPTGPKELLDPDTNFANIKNIKKTKYWYLTWLQKNCIENLVSAMEDFYKNQDIKYDNNDFKKIFSLENNISNWKNLIESL